MTSLKELSILAGVDVSTVSRALNDSPRVKPQTRDMIKELALQHNYIPNDIARGLVNNRTYTVGIIIPEFRNTFYAEIIEGIENILSHEGYSFLFGKSDFLYNNEIRYMNLFLQKRVDGIIACSISEKSVAHFLKSKRKLPLILADTYHLVEEVSSVSIDNSYGIKKVVEHLVQRGHKEIGFIGSSFVTSERVEAYKKSLYDYGLTYIDEYTAIGNERNEVGGYNRMEELLKLKNRPSAVIAETDNLAIGAMRSARERGLKIPQDISIVGFDDITVSSFIDTPLTTMIQPKLEIGKKAAELLLEQLNQEQSPQVKHVILKPELIIRNSTI